MVGIVGLALLAPVSPAGFRVAAGAYFLAFAMPALTGLFLIFDPNGPRVGRGGLLLALGWTLFVIL
jgi:hypothetical protein